MKRVIRKYYKQLYVNKIDNLHKMKKKNPQKTQTTKTEEI